MGQPALRLPGLSVSPSLARIGCAGTIISIDKPAGMTSFDVVAKIRRATGEERVGHAGTLDPFATGVLIVGIGRGATRRLGEISRADKEYLTRVQLGVATDTYDVTGKIISQSEAVLPAKSRIESVLRQFIGVISQTPPQFSAIKIKGRRAYKYARAGTQVTLNPRRVRIDALDLVEMTEDGFWARVVCSTGTYIRSLANDIGLALDCGACLAELRRTRIGEFSLKAALPLDAFLNSYLQAVAAT